MVDLGSGFKGETGRKNGGACNPAMKSINKLLRRKKKIKLNHVILTPLDLFCEKAMKLF